MRLPPGLCPGPRWGAYSAPQAPSWKPLGQAKMNPPFEILATGLVCQDYTISSCRPKKLIVLRRDTFTLSLVINEVTQSGRVQFDSGSVVDNSRTVIGETIGPLTQLLSIAKRDCSYSPVAALTRYMLVVTGNGTV